MGGDDTPRLSKTQVRKAGDRLRRQLRERELVDVENDPANLGDWEVVRTFQGEHIGPTSEVAEAVGAVSGPLDCGLPVPRIKRAERIIEKLARGGSSLDRLQDIGGCRMVVPGMRAQSEVVEAIVSLPLEIVRIDDYVAASGTSKFTERSGGPKGSGYRAIHIIHQVDDRFVETQVRTEIQHHWAMSAERAEQVTGFPLKFGDAPPELLDYFRVASQVEAVKEIGESADVDLQDELDELRERIRLYYRSTDGR